MLIGDNWSHVEAITSIYGQRRLRSNPADVMQKPKKGTAQSDVMKFIIHTDKFVILRKASILLQAQRYGLVTPEPFSFCEL